MSICPILSSILKQVRQVSLPSNSAVLRVAHTHTVRELLIGVAVCALSLAAAAQRKPICDVDCGPDPNVTGYSTVIAARAALINQRTSRHPLMVWSRLPFLARTVDGSQSYDYSINLLSQRGRNSLDVDLSLIYNSRIWNRSSSGLALNADLDNPSFGFRGIDYGFLQANSAASDYILTRQNGSKSELFIVAGTSLYQSHDSTYAQFDSSTNILVGRDGTQTFYAPFADGTVLRPTKIENTNGNFITIAYANTSNLAITTITDTLGRAITFTYDASGKLSTIQADNKTISFTWNTSYVLNYSFSLAVIGSPANASTQSVLSSVKLADGTTVNFLYGDWGIVNRIERRSASGALRAYVSYNFPAAAAGALNDAPGFTQQTMFDGVNTGTWTYGVSKNASGLVTSFSITDPAHTTTTSTFSANGDWKDGLQLTEQTTDSTGKLWRKRTRTWTADNTTTGINPHPDSITTQLDDGTQSQVTYAYDGNGNITDVREYDFGSSAPGALLRETVTTYATLGNHILNRPSQTLVKDGGGNIVARTDFAYDQYASVPLKPLTPAATQHDDLNYSTSPTAARGNLTTKTVYANAAAGTGAIVSTYAYDIAGNKVSAQDGCCTQATAAYSSITQYAFPDSLLIGPSGNQLSVSFTYNFNTGTVASATDANGQITSFTYDSNDRVTTVHTPDGVTTTTNFDSTSASSGWTQSNSANSQVITATTDFAGRTLSQQVLNGLSLVSTVTSTYDILGRLTKTSSPYGPSETAAETTYSYDALGREVDSTPPALVNGVTQGGFQTSYAGHTSTHTDPAGRQRREYRNALGQIIEVDEPGDAFNGTNASGTVSINGTLKSTTVGGSPAQQATGSITIAGTEKSVTSPGQRFCGDFAGNPPRCVDWETTPSTTINDSGTVNISVNGQPFSYSYGANDSVTSIANWFAASIRANSTSVDYTSVIVNTSTNPPTATINLIARTAGTQGNSITLGTSASTYDTRNFTSASFNPSVSGPNLTGGANTVSGTPVYDSGKVTLTVGGLSATANYGNGVDVNGNPLDSTAPSIAADLVAQIQRQLPTTNPPFSVSVPTNGTTININFNVPAAESASITSTGTQTAYFSTPSFAACSINSNPQNCTVSLGGADPYASGIAHPYVTQYAYNALGALTQVTQGQQVRNFVYDSLGRLVSQNVPERDNLADTFTYTDFGAIATRTDARGVKATYSYDALDRLSNIVYSDGTPTVTYTYGAAGAPNFTAGRLSKITDGSGSESYEYDSMGRLLKCTRVIGANTYVTTYSYTADGHLASITYPSGRVVTDQYDAIGRLTEVGTGGTSVLNIGSYNAANQILAMTYGNGTQATYSYNAQLQVASVLYGPSTAPILSLSYDWGGASDDGLLAGVTDNANPARSTNYSYDQLKRLVQARTLDQTSANTWNLQFTYDRYGNRLTETPIGGTATMPSNQVTIDPTTNRIMSSGYTYDADGDLTADGLHTYAFDGEHRLVHVDGTANTYAYDGLGQRVNRNGNYYLYSGGKVIAEYAAGAPATSPTAEYIYARGKRVATIAAGVTTYHYWDHMSIRSSANATGEIVRTFGHYPFGETWYETGTVDKWKFTTYERDAESGLDYASARFHSSRLGRFMSLDPWPAAKQNPQSWNRYAYTQNNPISLSDPSGMCDEEDDSCGDGGDTGDGGDPAALQDTGGDGAGGGAGGGDDAGDGGDGAGCGWNQACDSNGNCVMGCNDSSGQDNGGDQTGDSGQPGDDSNQSTDNSNDQGGTNSDSSNNSGASTDSNGQPGDNGQSNSSGQSQSGNNNQSDQTQNPPSLGDIGSKHPGGVLALGVTAIGIAAGPEAVGIIGVYQIVTGGMELLGVTTQDLGNYWSVGPP
jgi:RHS repeat-associated protein